MPGISRVDTGNTAKSAETYHESNDGGPTAGFYFTMLPRDFIRHQMQDLSGAELKVMLYILDHTLGYLDRQGQRKTADAISRSQFLTGITKADGTIVDRGAGVSDRSLDRALDGLEKRGLLRRFRQIDPSGRFATTVYQPVTNQPSASAAIHQGQENPPQSSVLIPPPELRPTIPAKLRADTRILPDTKENPLPERINQNTQTPALAEKWESGGGLFENKPKGEYTEDTLNRKDRTVPPQESAIAVELVKVGIGKGLAHALAATATANGHGPAYPAQILAYIAAQAGVKSREGLLIHLIKSGWSPPNAGYISPIGAATSPGSVRNSADYLPDSTVPLPTAASVNLALLPRLIALEERNLQEARTDRERQIARLRLDRFRLIEQETSDRETPSSVFRLPSSAFPTSVLSPQSSVRPVPTGGSYAAI